MFREIRDLDDDGSYFVVRSYLDKHRPAREPLPLAPPTVRDVTTWRTRHPDSLTEDDLPGLSAGDQSEGVAPQWRDSPVAARSAVICIMLPRIVALSATRAVPSGP